MTKILQYILKILAKLVLAKYKPRVVGITGSVGKTSAKEAVFAVLSPKFLVQKNLKNYNNEIGLPLSVLGLESAGKSIFGWLAVFLKTIFLIIIKDKKYPEILVLEMGVDRPGDMAYLLSIVKPSVGVITAIGQSHLEYFGTIDKVKEEKGLLVKNLSNSDWAILNYDDKKARELAPTIKAEIISYGLNGDAQVKAENINAVRLNRHQASLKFNLAYKGASGTVLLPGVIGSSAVYSVLAAASVGIAFGLSIPEICENLENFKLPLGRMNLLKGINNSFVIDDTYNSSPQSSLAALETIADISLNEGAKKIVVFGDMLELGDYEDEGHKIVGQRMAEIKIDRLIVVGERAELIAQGALESGMDEQNIAYFKNQEEAVVFIKNITKEDDLILVKGSQGARMEKIVKEIIADQDKAQELLVRQGSEWENK